MKRQRNIEAITKAGTKKKINNNNMTIVYDHQKIEEEEEEKGNIPNGEISTSTQRGISGLVSSNNNSNNNVKNRVNYLLGWEEELPWLRGGVDEQMWWGSIWLPFWDVEFMSEDCSNALFSNDFEDYDLWDLKNIREIPL
ncbi:hypothetical protein ACFE04_030555 [Oxalis oulophora]